MRKSKSRYIIPNYERIHHHLVVSPETHLAVKLYAQGRRLTITEATQELLSTILKERLGSANE